MFLICPEKCLKYVLKRGELPFKDKPNIPFSSNLAWAISNEIKKEAYARYINMNALYSLHFADDKRRIVEVEILFVSDEDLQINKYLSIRCERSEGGGDWRATAVYNP